jgi:hypothetical protein
MTMKNRNILLVIVLAIVALGTAIPVLAAHLGGNDNNGTLDIFRRPATAADRLPAVLGTLPMADHFSLVKVKGRVYSVSRYAGTTRGIRYYVVPGKGEMGPEVCLVGAVAHGAVGSCSPVTQLDGGIITNWTHLGDRTYVAGIAANGVTGVEAAGRHATVKDNVFFLTLPRGKVTFHLTGGSSAHPITYDLG